MISTFEFHMFQHYKKKFTRVFTKKFNQVFENNELEISQQVSEAVCFNNALILFVACFLHLYQYLIRRNEQLAPSLTSMTKTLNQIFLFFSCVFIRDTIDQLSRARFYL